MGHYNSERSRDTDIQPEQAGIMGRYDEEVMESPAVAEMPNLHQLLEEIKGCDQHIQSLYKQRQEYLNLYQTEQDKLAAHYDIVVNRPVDPGPSEGRSRF